MSATKEQLLAACNVRRTEDVTLPVSGLVVRVQSLTEREYSRYQLAVIDDDGKPTAARIAAARPLLMALSLVGEDGKRLFGDADGDPLADLDGKDVNAICNACYRVQDSPGVEAAAKN